LLSCCCCCCCRSHCFGVGEEWRSELGLGTEMGVRRGFGWVLWWLSGGRGERLRGGGGLLVVLGTPLRPLARCCCYGLRYRELGMAICCISSWFWLGERSSPGSGGSKFFGGLVGIWRSSTSLQGFEISYLISGASGPSQVSKLSIFPVKRTAANAVIKLAGWCETKVPRLVTNSKVGHIHDSSVIDRGRDSLLDCSLVAVPGCHSALKVPSLYFHSIPAP
jgi:hypothetical protein